MKTERKNIILVKSNTPPTVEIDTEARATYVRFKRAKVARTLRHGSKWPIVSMDLDAHGEIVGVEFVGVRKFNLDYLLKRVPLKAPPTAIDRANYVSAEAYRIAA
jgi:uncharacterized protein YuzE